MSENVRLRLITNTPLWTGGANGECDRIHETGIIGSLRWWYEVVVRGLGGEACDPSEHRCDFAAGLCDVCQVFGATGWQRRFKVVLSENLQDVMVRNRFLPSLRLRTKKGKEEPGGWYIMPGKVGSLIVEPGFEERHWLLLAVLSLMEKWTAIGARTNSGYGVFRCEGVGENEGKQVCTLVKWPEGNPFSNNLSGQCNSPSYPRLTDFFFAKVRFRIQSNDFFYKLPEVAAALQGRVKKKRNLLQENDVGLWLEKGCFPLSPVIRNWLRYTLFKDCIGGEKGNFVFGTTNKVCPECYARVGGNEKCPACKLDLNNKKKTLERIRSKIGISHAYKVADKESGGKGELWEFRIWGYIPRTGKPIDEAERGKLLGKLKSALLSGKSEEGDLWASGPLKGAEFAGVDWREFGSERDAVEKYADPWKYFKNLALGCDGR